MSGASPSGDDYRIEVRPAAVRDLKHLPPEIVRRVDQKILSLTRNPRASGVEALSGSSLFRARVGQYRILFAINVLEHLVTIARVRHRREVYRDLSDG